jgi:hypothetical protein
MEFGLSRFLEMFEERFGRTVTTAILALFGTAVALYCVKVIIEAIGYIYRLVRSAAPLAALIQQSAVLHIIIFAAQIALTFLVSVLIWRQFYKRRIRIIEEDLTATMNELESNITNFEQKVGALEKRRLDLIERMEGIKASHQEIMARFSPTEQHPPPAPPKTPEKNGQTS